MLESQNSQHVNSLREELEQLTVDIKRGAALRHLRQTVWHMLRGEAGLRLEIWRTSQKVHWYSVRAGGVEEAAGSFTTVIESLISQKLQLQGEVIELEHNLNQTTVRLQGEMEVPSPAP